MLYIGFLLALTLASFVVLKPMLYPPNPVVRAAELLYGVVPTFQFDYGGLV